MEIQERMITTKDYLTKSNLPASDYVINPYIGCKYCYACFMKRFTKHDEEWGTFVDIKHYTKPISKEKLKSKTVFMSPIFPGITDFREIIECCNLFIDEFWFENINLRGKYKATILSYIADYYPQYSDMYNKIYSKGDVTYWDDLALEIEQYGNEHRMISNHESYACPT